MVPHVHQHVGRCCMMDYTAVDCGKGSGLCSPPSSLKKQTVMLFTPSPVREDREAGIFVLRWVTI